MDGQYATTKSEGFADDCRHLGAWVDRLDAFIEALGAIDADDPFDYCADAWEIWQGAAAADPPPATDPAALVVLGVLRALAHRMTAATLDYYRTPDARDRMTLSAVHSSLRQCLGTVRRECGRWLHDGAPAADEIKARSAAAVASLQAATESGAGPTPDTGIMFDKVCALTDAENKRYREAYDRLRQMLNRELLQHISDKSDALSDVVLGIVSGLRATRGSTFDQKATEARRCKIRSALISFTSALHLHHEQSVQTAMRMFGRDSVQAKAVERLFDDLKQSSFDYRCLDALHQSLQCGDADAVRYQFTPRQNGEADVDVRLDREYLGRFATQTGRTWLWPEVTAMTGDPSVLDMVKAIQPKVLSLQERVDKTLYPNLADDVAAVKELIGRFGGQEGLDALRSAPGSTHKPWVPPHLSPRVLSFVRSYE